MKNNSNTFQSAGSARMKSMSHRNLYTGDSSYLFFDPEIYNPGGGPYTVKVIHDHIAHLAANGIDTYLCNPQGSGNWWFSKRMPTIFDGYRRGDREFVRRHAACDGVTAPPEAVEKHIDYLIRSLDHYLDLQEAGIDWVAECVRACRRYGISPWVTVRMNDMHGSSDLLSFFNAPPFRDAANHLSGRWVSTSPGGNPFTSYYFAGLNYALQPVRDFYTGTIRELIEEYDLDGLELDWLRNPLCCEPDAPQEQVDLVTHFHAEIRDLTRAKAKETGHPFSLGLRIPPNLGLLKSIGIDVSGIARAGVVDFINPSNFWQTSWDLPYDRYRAEFGDDVAIYGVIEGAPNWVEGYSPADGKSGTRLMATSAELLRGNAAGKLVMGVDGLEYFNFFCADSSVWHTGSALGNYAPLRDLPHLDRLRGQPKHYALSTMPGKCWVPPFEQEEQLPVILEPLWRRAFRLTMCAEPSTAKLTLQIVVEKKEKLTPLGVSLNGCWPRFESRTTDCLLFAAGAFSHHLPQHQAFDYDLPISLVRDGWNDIVLYNGASWQEKSDGSVRVVSIELAVRT
jgi:hypothetical protein